MDKKDTLLSQIKELEESLKKRNFSLSNSVKYMRAILDLQATIVFVLDKDEVIDGSQSYLYLFNYPTTDEMQKDFIDAFRVIDGKKHSCSELMHERDWVGFLLKHPDENFRIILEKDGIRYTFEILARSMLYKSGISDNEYKEYNYTVVSLNDITDLILEMKKSREKDFILMRQSKFAALGEMIANITHQWKQPLNSMGILTQSLEQKCKNGDIDYEKVKELTQKQLQLLESMDRTMQDFANFFKPDKQRNTFLLSEALHAAISIIEPSLKQIDTELQIDTKDDCKCIVYKNELIQAILNLLQNSRDAMESRPTKTIKATTSCRNEMAIITIEDTGGGVDKNVIDKVFEPYFTTKDSGTGIGLYMTRMIVEDSLNGSITVSNTEQGAKFVIMFPTNKRSYGA